MKTWLVGFSLFLAASAAEAGKAHVHGKGSMEVSYDDTSLEVELKVPLESVLGHERAPKNEEEKTKEAAEVERFVKSVKLGFNVKSCQFTSQKSEVDRHKGHADLELEMNFSCQKVPTGESLKLLSFETFPRLETVDVVIVGPTVQRKVSLSKSNMSFSL